MPPGLGGILVGKGRNASVAVQAAIPALRVVEHRDEVAFPREVWEDVYDTMLESYPGSRIVGWYHSHPGARPELSDYDRRLHAVLFSEAPSLALVIDPLSRQAAWYGWVLGRIAPVEPPGQTVSARPARRARTALAAALLVVAMAAGSAGYWVGRDRAPAGTEQAPADLRAKLGAAQSRSRELGERLADAQTALARLAAREAMQRAELAASRRRLVAARQAARPPAMVLRYEVREGDTLWALAERFYGSGWAWKRILATNAGRLGDPDTLPVGMKLEIPLP